jgi:hypothetical protein
VEYSSYAYVVASIVCACLPVVYGTLRDVGARLWRLACCGRGRGNRHGGGGGGGDGDGDGFKCADIDRALPPRNKAPSAAADAEAGCDNGRSFGDVPLAPPLLLLPPPPTTKPANMPQHGQRQRVEERRWVAHTPLTLRNWLRQQRPNGQQAATMRAEGSCRGAAGVGPDDGFVKTPAAARTKSPLGLGVELRKVIRRGRRRRCGGSGAGGGDSDGCASRRSGRSHRFFGARRTATAGASEWSMVDSYYWLDEQQLGEWRG